MTTTPTSYSGDHLRAIAMPLGGIGTGSIAICGDGSLRQVQIHHEPNHQASVPHTFFGIRVQQEGGEPVARVLQSDALYGDAPENIPPTSTDHEVPLSHQRLLAKLPGVRDITFTGTYPIARLDYRDPDLPVRVTLEAWSPFVPLDPDESGIPAIAFSFTVTNGSDVPCDISLVATLQNMIGWDGVAPIFDTSCSIYGGNRNEPWTCAHGNGVTMSADIPSDDPRLGTLTLTLHEEEASVLPTWTSLADLWRAFELHGRFDAAGDPGPSPAGKTWNNAIAAPFTLAPGESATRTFIIAWHIPNRMLNWQQWGVPEQDGVRLGVHYATRFSSATDVALYVHGAFDRLAEETRLAAATFHDTTLPAAIIEAVTSQISVMRSPTCFRTEDGNFYGFEGCHGASTAHHAPPTGGCCPLNCTHVWNYEHAVARLFPSLERTMRAAEWKHQLYPDGQLRHRVLLPLLLPRPDEQIVGGPEKPALDGLLGAILKTYREFLACGDDAWLDEMWPGVMRALDFLWTECDPERSGIILREQPNTYDISIFGANTFIGTLYLAALRAIEEMAKRRQDRELALSCHQVFLAGSRELDRRLWNGQFYIQDVDLSRHAEQNYATGCHIDQLCGQWWADHLGLGDLLDSEHLSTATLAIFRHNFRESIDDFKESERRFAVIGDAGTIVCTWPNGGRPEVPTRYSDEVWTGLEYELGALLMARGHVAEAERVVAAVRDRHDGRLQNPWNDIECGDHYVRAMSSWTLLERATGFHYNAAERSLAFAPVYEGPFRAPFVAGEAYGMFNRSDAVTTIRVARGELTLDMLTIDGQRRDLGGRVLSPDTPLAW